MIIIIILFLLNFDKIIKTDNIKTFIKSLDMRYKQENKKIQKK